VKEVVVGEPCVAIAGLVELVHVCELRPEMAERASMVSGGQSSQRWVLLLKRDEKVAWLALCGVALAADEAMQRSAIGAFLRDFDGFPWMAWWFNDDHVIRLVKCGRRGRGVPGRCVLDIFGSSERPLHLVVDDVHSVEVHDLLLILNLLLRPPSVGPSRVSAEGAGIHRWLDRLRRTRIGWAVMPLELLSACRTLASNEAVGV
jgi:hypothetical protein